MASAYNIARYSLDRHVVINDNNLLAAAVFIARLLESNGIHYAVMGGFCMRLRGSLRTTFDIDVAANCTMKILWDVFTPQTRLILPNTRLIEGIMRVFVKTGPGVGDNFCSLNQRVNVDISVDGANGSPLVVANARESLPVQLLGHQAGFSLYGLNILYMMKSKLYAFAARQAQKDFLDILHLLDFYPTQITFNKRQLNRSEILFFYNSNYFTHLEIVFREKYREILGV